MFNASFLAPRHVIALDNITVTDENLLSGVRPPPVFSCPRTVAVPSVSCTFEDDVCSWTNTNSPFGWKLVADRYGDPAATPGEITTAAHGSKIAVVRANDRPINDSVARFTSKPIAIKSEIKTILEFWYHMRGPGNRYLKVILQRGSSSMTVWERNGDQGSYFQQF